MGRPSLGLLRRAERGLSVKHQIVILWFLLLLSFGTGIYILFDSSFDVRPASNQQDRSSKSNKSSEAVVVLPSIIQRALQIGNGQGGRKEDEGEGEDPDDEANDENKVWSVEDVQVALLKMIDWTQPFTLFLPSEAGLLKHRLFRVGRQRSMRETLLEIAKSSLFPSRSYVRDVLNRSSVFVLVAVDLSKHILSKTGKGDVVVMIDDFVIVEKDNLVGSVVVHVIDGVMIPNNSRTDLDDVDDDEVEEGDGNNGNGRNKTRTRRAVGEAARRRRVPRIDGRVGPPRKELHDDDVGKDDDDEGDEDDENSVVKENNVVDKHLKSEDDEEQDTILDEGSRRRRQKSNQDMVDTGNRVSRQSNGHERREDDNRGEEGADEMDRNDDDDTEDDGEAEGTDDGESDPRNGDGNTANGQTNEHGQREEKQEQHGDDQDTGVKKTGHDVGNGNGNGREREGGRGELEETDFGSEEDGDGSGSDEDGDGEDDQAEDGRKGDNDAETDEEAIPQSTSGRAMHDDYDYDYKNVDDFSDLYVLSDFDFDDADAQDEEAPKNMTTIHDDNIMLLRIDAGEGDGGNKDNDSNKEAYDGNTWQHLPCNGHGKKDGIGGCKCAVLWSGPQCKGAIHLPGHGDNDEVTEIMPFSGNLLLDKTVFFNYMLPYQMMEWSATKQRSEERIKKWWVTPTFPEQAEPTRPSDHVMVLKKALSSWTPSMMDEVADMLPSHDVIRNGTKVQNQAVIYDTCAVVGNSGAMRMRKRGEEIDRHDMVMRINGGPTAGYEEFVGKKTTWRAVGGRWFGFAEGNEEHVINILSPHILRQQISLLVRLKRASHDMGDVFILNPLFVGSVIDIQRDRPAVGLTAVMLALQMCRHVDVYGFFLSHREGFQFHYFDNVTRSRREYTRTAELETLTRLHNSNILTMESCIQDCLDTSARQKCLLCLNLSAAEFESRKKWTAAEIAANARWEKKVRKSQMWRKKPPRLTMKAIWEKKKLAKPSGSGSGSRSEDEGGQRQSSREAQETTTVVEKGKGGGKAPETGVGDTYWSEQIRSGKLESMSMAELLPYFFQHSLVIPRTKRQMEASIRAHHHFLEGRFDQMPKKLFTVLELYPVA